MFIWCSKREEKSAERDVCGTVKEGMGAEIECFQQMQGNVVKNEEDDDLREFCTSALVIEFVDLNKTKAPTFQQKIAKSCDSIARPARTHSLSHA